MNGVASTTSRLVVKLAHTSSGMRQNVIPGARELGAEQHREQAADAEEEDRRDDVLDADHLVVGVDAEVVAPALRAVTGVVLGQRRAAERIASPVVEAADPDEEPERCGNEL